jgi:histone H3/H4
MLSGSGSAFSGDDLDDGTAAVEEPPPKRRAVSGKRAFKEYQLYTGQIKMYQGSRCPEYFFPKIAFARLIKEALGELSGRDDLKITYDGLLALQYSAEMHVTDVMEKANHCAAHNRRVTVMPKDLDFLKRLGILPPAGSSSSSSSSPGQDIR